jgi:hypothetical protein
MSRFLTFVFTSWLFFATAQAVPLKPEQVPSPLQPWVQWVLAETEDYPCPLWYSSAEGKNCRWSGHLGLNLNNTQGTFTSTWQLYKEDWLTLPGDNDHWPLNVTVNNKPVLVMNRDEKPMVKLPAGVYQLQGQFLWDSIPESLTIPEESGLIDLSINGKSVPFPAIKEGSIWLKESDTGQKKAQAIENKLDLQVFRQVDDDVPLQLITFLELEVAGQQREIKLPHALLAEFIPIKLQSPLPARIEADGTLALQVRPGRWHLELYARHPKPLTELKLNFTDKTWPQAEIWVFNARPAQRLVEVQNVNAIDPSQTNLPAEWKNLPAYQMAQNEGMKFNVLRRGDPEPEPNNLSLNRELWLDFDGSGYTIQDQISGKMTNGWRLTTTPDMQLGQVKLNGESQLITQLPGSPQQGVEVRQGQLDLKADSRLIGGIGTINAVGWEQSFHQVNATLRLPPGWKLLAATGVDNDPNCWVSNWTLLDLFLVFITAVAVGQLWNRYWGGFALVTLTLIWHEPDAPQLIWLNILAALALLRVLPNSKFFTFIEWYRNLSWLCLLLIILPFLVDQVRIGLYPQLEKPWQPITNQVAQSNYQTEQAKVADEVANVPAAPAPAADAAAPAEEAAAPEPQEDQAQQQAMPKKAMEMAMNAKAKADAGAKAKVDVAFARAKTEANAAVNATISGNAGSYYAQKSVNFNRIDPNATVQTGVGSPQWQWSEVQLSWNGAVDSHQQLSFWYLTPTMTLFLNFIRAILVTVLAALLFGWATKIDWKRYAPLSILLILFTLSGLPTEKAYADFPPQPVLDQLKARLLEAPDCLPNCADIPSMKVTITPDKLMLVLKVHAQQSAAVPLPALYKEWMPNQVTVDGQTAPALWRADDGALWLNVAAGEHQVQVSGLTPAQSKFTLPLTLKPHYVSTEASGWLIEGVHENGEAEEQLQFNRVQTTLQQNPQQPLEQGALPAFITVERTLELGLDWRLTTKINRVITADAPVFLEVPLLKGESVTTPDVRVKNGKVQVNLSANDSTLEWASVLEKPAATVAKIELNAPQTTQWTEVWRADVSPIWHLQTSGISVVHHQDQQGYWLPEWRPWPGEKVLLTITRPAAMVGRTLTIDSSRLQITPGKRSQDASLEVALRSSKGGQHTVWLPKNATLQSVLIDNTSQPIRQKGNAVTLPIKPGSQQIMINWQELLPQSGFLQTPLVNLGVDSVNAHLSVHLGEDRWVLLTAGPRFGPAVLFWGVLIVLVFVSIGLGKLPFTPLKHWHWFLLLIGLSQIELVSALIVVAWLIALGLRAKPLKLSNFYFNALQVSLSVLTVVALSLLYSAVHHGLLESPDMQIVGNQSDALHLNWYQDRTEAALPQAMVIMLPLKAYRIFMLLWALWLAASLLSWLKWGWTCFASGGLWQKISLKKKDLVVEPPTE